MSEQDPLPSQLQEEVSPNQIPQPEAMTLVREIIELERNKLTVESKAIEASDEQDKRIAAFHTRRLQLSDEADQRRVRLVSRVFIGMLVV